MKTNNIIKSVITAKFQITDRILGILPEELQPSLKQIRRNVLVTLRDIIDQQLETADSDKKDPGLNRINLD